MTTPTPCDPTTPSPRNGGAGPHTKGAAVHNQPAPLDDYRWPACGCGRQLRQDELDRASCRICQARADAALSKLPGPVTYRTDSRGERKLESGLYAALAATLKPGRSGDNVVVSASRTPPLPLRLMPLSLTARGGVVTVLQEWQVAWHEHFGWRHPRWRGGLQQQLDDVVAALRVNLEGAAGSHPAFADFTHEVCALVRQCERQVTGERPERPVAVSCPCGTVLRVTVSTPGCRCRGCGVQYTRSEVLNLPLAQRSAQQAGVAA